ncbi:glycosyltransferase [Fundicoccus sp. Sow4_F4]|uniref:glycosyltransferase n=1 Tax=Fundicoccus sp. Sow4_F4 TaxID=3438783 RepID=UPI003F939642
MRILQINSFYGFGSTGRIVENLHHAIMESGNESYVIYGRGKSVNEANVFKIGNPLEQAIDLAATRLFNRHGQTILLATRMIINKIKEINPDIVHLHNIHGYYVNFPRLLKYLKESGVKVVWLLHDPWIISGSSADSGAIEYEWENPINHSKLVKISKEYPIHSQWSSERSIKNYEIKKKLLQKNNFTFVTPSKWLAEIIDRSYLHGNDIKVIHNGINTNQFKVVENHSRNQSKKINILGIASVWEKRKGLEYFNKLAEDLETSYSITLVGKLIPESGTPHTRIKHIERTESIDELVELYNQADAFINPTLFDNFPTVNLESQACGTPVVTFDTGGAGESITDLTGRVVEKGNYSELLNCIRNSQNKNKETLLKCTENATNYSISGMIKNYLELYQSKLDEKK